MGSRTYDGYGLLNPKTLGNAPKEGLVVLAENRSRGYMHVELTCESSSLQFSRGLCALPRGNIGA